MPDVHIHLWYIEENLKMVSKGDKFWILEYRDGKTMKREKWNGVRRDGGGNIGVRIGALGTWVVQRCDDWLYLNHKSSHYYKHGTQTAIIKL